MSETRTEGGLPRFTIDFTKTDAPPLRTEWLLTNGTGAFAMGTAAGANTRRYHGLLVGATDPPVGRVVALSQVLETIGFDGQRRELGTCEFAAEGASVLHPQGWRHLTRFDKDIAATWHYRIGPVAVTRRLRLIHKRQMGVLEYRIEPTGDGAAPDRVCVELRPLVAMRDFHALRQAFVGPRLEQAPAGPGVTVTAGDLPALRLEASAGRYVREPDWWHHFFYRVEAQRQQDCTESLYCPGRIEHTFDGGQAEQLALAFGIEPIDWPTIRKPDARAEHLRPIIAHVGENHAALAVASDDFVVDRTVQGERSTTIIAGYPWFSDWGRDTMIALPGCLLTTGRFDEARRTLLTFATHIRRGLVPNRFDDYGGDPHYNTVDAPLWFVHAALEYREATADEKTWRHTLADACRQVLDGYAAGTDFDIRLDGDGLITAGNWQTQLTWMDAARDGVVFTPRHGKAVEINALWHRALVGLGQALGEAGSKYLSQAQRAKRNFVKVFWSDELGYCHDHVTDAYADRSLRPNQVLAASLPASPLPITKQKAMLQAVRQKLLTPMGLRTLPPDDPNYHGRYEGSMFQRDQAYHQGTVWPWPLGHFVEAWLRAHKFSKKSRTQARAFLQPLIDSLDRDGLGSMSEIYDADPPHPPRGCPAQAWSVSEVLRVTNLIDRDTP